MVAKKIKCKRILLKSNENKKKEIENKSNIIYIYMMVGRPAPHLKERG
jgi:uncharacterized protein Veg